MSLYKLVNHGGFPEEMLRTFKYYLLDARMCILGVCAEALQQQSLNGVFSAETVRQVVLRVVCVTVVAGIGETDLLLHLLTNVAPFKEVKTL